MHELKIPYKAHEEYVKGLERLAKNDLTESLRHFAKAAKTFPDYYEAYYHMGLVETKLGHKNEAKQAFQTSIDLSGGRYAWAQFGFGYILFLEGKLTEAETLIRRGLELDANSSEGYVILGMTQLALNHLEDAEKSAREALLRNPGYAKAFLVLADVCSRRHDYRAQLQNLEAYLKLDPAGSTNQRIRQAREMAMQLLAKSGSPN
jgi:tetratricopeptide (TPR) repeat protein